jgi:hypothetical protein
MYTKYINLYSEGLYILILKLWCGIIINVEHTYYFNLKTKNNIF